MKRYGYLFDKIADIENIKLAHRLARRGKTHYSQVKMFDSNPDYYAREIHNMLVSGKYKTSEYIKFEIFDRNKSRTIYKLPYYPDRVVHWAIMIQLETVFMRTFIKQTCAALPGRGTHYALAIENRYLTEHPKETKYCLKLDIRKYFQHIDKEILLKLLYKKFKDPRLLNLLREIIYSTEDSGVPIGNYLSQYFANYYLSYFDHWLKEELHVKYYIRYMDDMVIYSDSKEFLQELLIKIDEYLRVNLHLELKANYQIFPVDVRGVDFVGYRHFRSYILLRKSTAARFKKVIHRVMRQKFMNDSTYNSITSYTGWFKYGNCYRLESTYISMISPMLINYLAYHDRQKEAKSDER